MANMMKAAVVTELGKPLDVREVEKPVVSDGSIVVRVEASGVCHTDLHAAEGDWPVKPAPPFIPGHEGVGIVAEVGKDVRSVKEGDRVGVPGYIPLAVVVVTAPAGGRRCVPSRSTPDTAPTAVLRNLLPPIPTTSATCPTRWVLPPARRSSAPA